MHALVGFLAVISAVFAYAASGWIYGDNSGEVSVTDVPVVTKLVQQNFDDFSQRALRKQISECMKDSYQYLAMSMYFDQTDIALPGFHKMFKDFSDREMSNAIKLMNYMNLREGALKLSGVQEPKVSNDWQNGEAALLSSLRMEKKANTKFMTLLKLSLEKHDPHLKQFIEDSFLDQKVKVIKDLGDKITRLGKYKVEHPGLGLQMFDNSLLG